ncbi:MAG: hypothetical protein WA639_18045 [Candidatus Acidiferrum sp.]
MIRENPPLNQLQETLRFFNNFFRFRASGDGSMIVVDHVSFAPARLEKSSASVADVPNPSRAASNVRR